MLATVWTNFENEGPAITGNGNVERWNWKKNREITTNKPENEKWP